MSQTIVIDDTFPNPIEIKQFNSSKESISFYTKQGNDFVFTRTENIGEQDKASLILLQPIKFLKNFLLPRNYETAVTKSYIKFAQWSIVSSVFMTLSSIMSMQALLFAVGIGATTALPMAAALNWILKDGLGQLGGMLCASFIHTKFDAQPRQWRFLAGSILDVSFLLETLTPLFPALFLPIASTTNIGKNIGWISASASRAAIHKSFMLTENLADITGKAGSQSIFASIIGTGLGLGVAPALNILFGYNNVYLEQPLLIFGATFAFCTVHLLSLRKSLSYVAINTLDLNRLLLASLNSVEITVKDHSLFNELCLKEKNFSLKPLEQLTDIDFNKVKAPSLVTSLERVLTLDSLFPRRLMQFSSSRHMKTGINEPLLKTSTENNFSIKISPSISEIPFTKRDELIEVLGSSRYYLCCSDENPQCFLLFIENKATSDQVLEAALTAIISSKFVAMHPTQFHSTSTLIRLSQHYAKKSIGRYIQQLREAGWQTDSHFIEFENRRLSLV